MRGLMLVLAALLLASQPVDAAAMHAQLIYRIDHVSVSVQGRKMIVSAQGAVKTGGWENARLRVKEIRIPESDTLVIEFVATPPPKDAVVIEALLPVSATLTAPLAPYGTTQIKVLAETNSMIAPYKP